MPANKTGQPAGMAGVRLGQLIFAVALEGRLLGKVLYLPVGEGDGLYRLKTRFRGQLQVGVLAAGACQQAENKEAGAIKQGRFGCPVRVRIQLSCLPSLLWWIE